MNEKKHSKEIENKAIKAFKRTSRLYRQHTPSTKVYKSCESDCSTASSSTMKEPKRKHIKTRKNRKENISRMMPLCGFLLPPGSRPELDSEWLFHRSKAKATEEKFWCFSICFIPLISLARRGSLKEGMFVCCVMLSVPVVLEMSYSLRLIFGLENAGSRSRAKLCDLSSHHVLVLDQMKKLNKTRIIFAC